MDVGQRIKERRKALHMSAETVAAQLGVSPATVYRYESSEIMNMRTDKLEPIAKILKTTPAYLMGWEESPDAHKAELPKEAVPYEPTHRIPILGRIAAGQPLYADENIEGYTYTDLNGGAEYFALRVKGDSMNAARIFEGDIIIVRKQDTVEPGDIAVVMVGDEATVKRWYQTDSTVTLMPQSTNPKHKPQIYDPKETPISILGRVVKVEYTL